MTLFIIVPCFIGLFKENEKTGNVIGVLIGIALFLGCQDIINFDLIWKLALPTILVIICLSIIFKDTLGGKVNDEIKKLNEKRNGANTYCATFSGQKVKFDKKLFAGADLTAVFGGVENKSNTSGEENTHTIYVNGTAIFGGVEIK